MRFDSLNEMEGYVSGQDPIACNVCQSVLKFLRSRRRFWLVKWVGGSAVVCADNQTSVKMAVGNHTLTVDSIEEIDPDSMEYIMGEIILLRGENRGY